MTPARAGAGSFARAQPVARPGLIIIPIIIIYRKYYGWKAALRITGIFYGAMVLAGYAVELLFTPLGLIPTNRHLSIVATSISWNYTTWLKIVFVLIAAFLLIVFVRSGSWSMLRMMSAAPEDNSHYHSDSTTK